MSDFQNLKGKLINDFTEEERKNMTSEERRYLRETTKEILRKRGYYTKVRRMSVDKPLNPNVPEDYHFGQSIGIFE